MKTVYCCFPEEDIEFSLNWFEYIILKKIFEKQKFKIIKKNKLKGRKIDFLIYDEVAKIDEKTFNKIKGFRK